MKALFTIKALQKLYEKVACLHVDIFNDTDLVFCILSKCDWINISESRDIVTVKEVLNYIRIM